MTRDAITIPSNAPMRVNVSVFMPSSQQRLYRRLDPCSVEHEVSRALLRLDQLDVYDGDMLTVVIETPKRSQNNFGVKRFMLKACCRSVRFSPFDFGMIPSTEGGARLCASSLDPRTR
jgi:hypothetical protein